MPEFENTQNLNNSELNPSEIGADVNAAKNLEGELTPEELEKLKVEEGQEQKSEKPELSPEEQLKNLENEMESLQQEITRLAESINETKSKLNEVREKLGLPPIEEEPPSTFLEKDKLEKLKAEREALEKQKEDLESQENKQENKREEKQESKEGGESLKENDLIVSENGIKPAIKILKENKIQYKDREYTKRQVLDAKTDTAIPGEFILTIFDPEHTDRPASFDFVKQVFKLIKDSKIAVRYGKNPERS